MAYEQDVKDAFHELREAVEQKNDEIDRLGNALETTEARLEDAQAKLDELDGLKERQERLETKLDRPGMEVETTSTSQSEARKAFGKWLNARPVDSDLYRKELYPGDETKDLSIGSGENQSDALAPAEFVEELIEDAVEISPVRQVARIITTDRKQVEIPQLLDRPQAAYTSETGTRSNDSNLDFGADNSDMLVIDLPEFYVQIGVTRQMVEDSAFDVEAEVQEKVATEMTRLQGEKFLQGSGTNEPQGLLSSGDFETVLGSDSTGDITSLTAEDIREFPLRLKQQYRDNGLFGVTREALRHLRTLKDPSGEFIFEPSLDASTPATIDGFEYAEMQDLVDSATAGANDVPVVFGDFESAYYVADRLQMEVIRDPYSAKESGKIEYHFRGRSGGDLALGEAVKGLEVNAVS